jgi:sialic acid synthase SpsE
LYITKDVKKGEVISEDNVRSVRPSFGMPPKHYEQVLGKTFNDNFEKGTPLSFDLIN